MTLATAPAAVTSTVRRGLNRVMTWESTASSFVMLLGSSVLLVVFGLVMVLSSSSVTSIAEGKSPFSEFATQGVYALVGGVGMAVASRLPVRVWKALAWPSVGVSVVLLCLVAFTPLGHEVNGNRNWLDLGYGYLQPSELVKLSLVVWCAAILAMKQSLLQQWGHALIPVAPVAGMLIGLVMVGHDLGTALIMMIIVFSMMFVAGVPLRMFAVAGAVGAVATTFLVVSSANRMERISAWLHGDPDTFGSTWQADHGRYALASGGFGGLGLGASREKWNYLPEAHNDFIYAIIGEELGIPGTVGVLVLLSIIGVACVRIIHRHDDMFVKIATAGVFAWIVGQAFINISVVVGLLPVLGIPLPLVSSGGSSLIATMLALGMLLSFGRSETSAKAAT